MCPELRSSWVTLNHPIAMQSPSLLQKSASPILSCYCTIPIDPSSHMSQGLWSGPNFGPFFGPCVTLTLVAFDKWFKKKIFKLSYPFMDQNIYFLHFHKMLDVPGHTASANVKLDCYVTGHTPDDSINSEILE